MMEVQCPRCGLTEEQETYGPCGDCRRELVKWADEAYQMKLNRIEETGYTGEEFDEDD